MRGQDVGRWGEGGSKVYAAQMITMVMMMFDFCFCENNQKTSSSHFSEGGLSRGV